MEELKRFLRQRIELDEMWILPTPLSQGRCSPEPTTVEPVKRTPKTAQSSPAAIPAEQTELVVYSSDEAKYCELNQYTTLDELQSGICDCMRCPLGRTRNKFVFGIGSQTTDLMFIGEAPGADEDMQGFPFVGRAGQLLTEMMTEAGIVRDDVYICNVLKCRPPNNRDPEPQEVSVCEGYLHRQIELIQPKLLVALGRIAAQTLLRKPNVAMGVLKTQEHSYRGVPLMVVYHPAYTIRNIPKLKPEAIADLILVRDRLIELGGVRGIAVSE